MFDLVWNLIDTSNGVYVIDTFPTLLECAEAADYYVETVRLFLSCAMARSA